MCLLTTSSRAGLISPAEFCNATGDGSGGTRRYEGRDGRGQRVGPPPDERYARSCLDTFAADPFPLRSHFAAPTSLSATGAALSEGTLTGASSVSLPFWAAGRSHVDYFLECFWDFLWSQRRDIPRIAGWRLFTIIPNPGEWQRHRVRAYASCRSWIPASARMTDRGDPARAA